MKPVISQCVSVPYGFVFMPIKLIFISLKNFAPGLVLKKGTRSNSEMAHCFEVRSQVGTDEMAEMEEMVRKGTEGNQAKWALRALLEKKVKRSNQGDPFRICRATLFLGPLPRPKPG